MDVTRNCPAVGRRRRPGHIEGTLEMTACDLYALAHGAALAPGTERCFYCGASCDRNIPLTAYLKDTFTDFGIVAAPESNWTCTGCVLALREKADDIPGRDGKPQKVRNYSWLVTANSAIAFTKADKADLRRACLDPPPPPFALAIAETGQKHVLFRTPVNVSSDPITVQLDAASITYRRADLAGRIDLAARLAPTIGVSRLLGALSTGAVLRLIDDRGDEALAWIDEWIRVQGEPLSRLAVFLTPSDGDLTT